MYECMYIFMYLKYYLCYLFCTQTATGIQIISVFFFKLVRMIDAGVQYEDLQLIERDDLKELIPPFALRIRFREKLFTWKKNSVRCLITYTFFSLNT